MQEYNEWLSSQVLGRLGPLAEFFSAVRWQRKAVILVKVRLIFFVSFRHLVSSAAPVRWRSNSGSFDTAAMGAVKVRFVFRRHATTHRRNFSADSPDGGV